jgi:hypothetical protein
MCSDYFTIRQRQREIQRHYYLGKFLELIQHLVVLGIFLLFFSTIQMFCAG